MYCNLKAELKRRAITLKQLGDALGVRTATAWNKLNGHTYRGFTNAEKKAIFELLGMEPTEDNYEYLFARAA